MSCSCAGFASGLHANTATDNPYHTDETFRQEIQCLRERLGANAYPLPESWIGKPKASCQRLERGNEDTWGFLVENTDRVYPMLSKILTGPQDFN